jgi:arginine-tRNA-protein transferase
MLPQSQDLVQIVFPAKVQGKVLDDFLEEGWFRNCSSMYRSKIICLDAEISSIVNIRLPLEGYRYPKRLAKLFRKHQERFRVKIAKMQIDDTKEALYKAHANRFKGYVFESLKEYMHDTGDESKVFDTLEVAVYDGTELVAFSFFDVGEQSIATILGVYRQDYSAYSLGMFTMLLEVEHALEAGKAYYYPGYVFHQPSVFDYKLRLGDFEYFNWKEWQPYHKRIHESWLSNELYQAHALLKKALDVADIRYQEFFYVLYSMGYMVSSLYQCFKELYFLEIYDYPMRLPADSLCVAAYLPSERRFALYELSLHPFSFLMELPQTKLEYPEKHFTEPLCYRNTLFESDKALDLVLFLKGGGLSSHST